jgi:hypothetical protein
MFKKNRTAIRLHWYISGNADGDVELCQILVERNLQLYSNVSIAVYFYFLVLQVQDRRTDIAE